MVFFLVLNWRFMLEAPDSMRAQTMTQGVWTVQRSMNRKEKKEGNFFLTKSLFVLLRVYQWLNVTNSYPLAYLAHVVWLTQSWVSEPIANYAFFLTTATPVQSSSKVGGPRTINIFKVPVTYCWGGLKARRTGGLWPNSGKIAIVIFRMTLSQSEHTSSLTRGSLKYNLNSVEFTG